MEIDNKTLISYIKERYPRMVFNPVNKSKEQLNKQDNTKTLGVLGVIVSDDKVIEGYINEFGNLCNLIEPIDLGEMTDEKFSKVINNIPLVKGELNSERSLVSKEDEERFKTEIKELSNMKAKYDVLIDIANKETVLLKKEYSNNIDEIKLEHNKELEKLQDNVKSLQDVQDNCIQKILNEKEEILKGIQKYKEQVSEYIKNIVFESEKKGESLKELYDKLLDEKTTVEHNMNMLIEREKERFAENALDKSTFEKENVIKNLEDTIQDIQDELEKIQQLLSVKELENVALSKFNDSCIDSILKDKEMIIENIKRYNKEWIDWVDNNNINVDEQKMKLQGELGLLFTNLKKVIEGKDKYIENLNSTSREKDKLINQLHSNVSDIKAEINKSLQIQLSQLSIKNEELIQKVKQEEDQSVDRETTILELRKELEKVKDLLNKNNDVVVEKVVDYKSCQDTLSRFIIVNNIFYRKKQVIAILDKIMNDTSISNFSHINESIRGNLKKEFETIKTEINKHISFLDLNKYVKSPVIKFFQSSTTLKKIPAEFCDELNNISIYWANNVELFNEQDRRLTNLYEDLSGAVRVFIRVKPLLGVQQKNKTVLVDTNTRKVTVDCSGISGVDKKESFGDYYGVFGETFSNRDIYTGVEGNGNGNGDLELMLDVEPEISHPGLYSTFKQVEDGYSIVIFGYGQTGSGKTFTLLGDTTTPGLLHYGLANLKNVQNIKLKYMFEQYIDKFVPTINKIRGEIINLVREVPQLRKYSRDETKEFSEALGVDVNVNNLTIQDINILTSIVEKYRIKHDRIKKTPNNPVSSRSHLYMVYEITFDTGKIGYITIVDTAGRESPIDIYNLFIDTTKVSLTTLLGPTGGIGVVNKFLKEEYRYYSGSDVYDILREGVYINETINHLIYYFNKKNYKTNKILQQISLEKYSEDKYYVSPKVEENDIDESNNCLMIPILKFLDVLSNRKHNEDAYKPTKFVTIVCIRKDESYCNQIFASLDFASKISSS